MNQMQTVNCNEKIVITKNSINKQYNNSAKGSLIFAPSVIESTLTYLLSQIDLQPVLKYLEKCKDQNIFYTNILNNTPIILLFKRIIVDKNMNSNNSLYKPIYELLTKDKDNFDTIYSSYLAFCKKPSEYSSIHAVKNSTIYNTLTSSGQSSNELNSSLFEYFYTDLPLLPIIKENSLDIIKAFNSISSSNSLTVFHGTNIKVHGDSHTFTTYAFLSTTIDLNVARSYGEIIYIIKIPPVFPYINLGDNCNKQILLPIGTQVKIENYSIKDKIYFGTINNTENENIISKLKTIECVLKNDNKLVKMPIVNELLNVTLSDTPSKQVTKRVNTQPIKKQRCSKYSCNAAKSFCKGASTIKFYKDKDNDTQYALKFGQHADDNYNIRRMINEVFAAHLYRYLGMATLDHKIVKTMTNNNAIYNNKYCLQSEFKSITYRDPTLDEAKEYLSEYLWDCILANWDVGNKGNIGFLNDKEIIRTDVGGALAYRARGEFKLSFFNNSPPKEHIFLLQQPFVKKCFNIYLNSLESNKYDQLFDVLYSNINLEKLNTNTLSTLSIFPQYQNFITKIVDRVKERCNYYIQNKDNIIKPELKRLLTELFLPQTSMIAGSINTFLKYNSDIYKIKNLKIDKYILVKNKRVFLKDIRGKYRYIKSGGSEPVEEEDIDDEEYILYDITSTNTAKTLDELLQTKNASCVIKQNNKQ